MKVNNNMKSREEIEIEIQRIQQEQFSFSKRGKLTPTQEMLVHGNRMCLASLKWVLQANEGQP